MTNIIAAIAFTITTNWTTTGILSPPPKPASNIQTLEYRPTWELQSGVVMSNTVARFVWKGQTNDVVLESVPILQGLERRRDYNSTFNHDFHSYTIPLKP